MAIVEDDARNDSEEENEIEVVVEEDDADQDSEDSDDEEDLEVLEKKVKELEQHISEDPYDYNEHMILIHTLWALSEFERWRAAYDRLQQLYVLKPEHWLERLQIETSLAHSQEFKEHVTELFQQATLDCYSIPILSQWCTWSLGLGDVKEARAQIEEVLRRAGADPLSGKLFWDAKLELEKTQLEAMTEEDEEYKAQKQRILWCLEETVSRPLLRSEEAWQQLQELAFDIRDQEYVDKVKIQHEAALEFLQKITQYEDELLTLENPEEKCKLYEKYIDRVKDLSENEKYRECDTNGILKVLYDRVTTECMSCESVYPLLVAYARVVQRNSSRATYWRVLDTCTRRCPKLATFWILKMQQAEHEEKEFDYVKSLFETALSKGMESYKEAEALWLGYLEYIRRRTAFEDEEQLERLRRTFRLAWDSLATMWGDEANDCEVPLYWARLEYKRIKQPKQGKEIFEEIFKYGENKTYSKYWEAYIQLECSRDPPPSENKLRDLHRRALKFVTDYPPAAARLWTDFERDYGTLVTARECASLTQVKLKEWRDNYQAMKEKMTGQKIKGKQMPNKKPKFDKNKKDNQGKNKNKRKSDEADAPVEAKRKREENMEVEVKADEDRGGGVKRSHGDDNADKDTESKRQRTDTSLSDLRGSARDACTLFVSNLDFKVNEQDLREKLEEHGDIVSLRLKAGVKAFGGSICYCQYKDPESVDKALKHDRAPLNGRPMFFSRYSAKKTKPLFRYATTAEKNKLFVKNLPYSHCSKEALTEIFSKYGKLKDVRPVTFKDGKPKGLAYIEYEDEAASAEAIEKTNGMLVGDRNIDVAVSAPPPRPLSGADSLGQPKRENTGGMRRTQLSSFIPSVLQNPSTSKAVVNGSHSNGDEKRPLSNSDFRNMLLKK